ncbi:hypothetical protein [Deinococcus pimensis]|uniref:hypothetical protein n=1 Tax=Deinococcus pimensis TaxID=309888 RepID=UPI0012F70FA1|nr:hypothetical protein [Deinococcus pimensis]
MSHEGRRVHLSAKATALLAYLALERSPQHREHLADLLWESHDALGNLRVELARLRQQGLDLFPARQPMLSLECATDLDRFVRGETDVSERELAEWLGTLRGLPLSGLEDLGTSTFQEWVETQRLSLAEQVEEVLSRVYTRQVEAGRDRAAEMIRARAELLGVENLRLVRRGGPPQLHFDRPEARGALMDVLSLAEHEPQLLLLGGRRGIGKRSFVQEALVGSDWVLLQVNAVPQRRLFLASLAQALMRVSPPDSREVLQSVLLRPGDADEDLVRIFSVLASLGRPVVLSIHRAEHAREAFAGGVGFALGLPIPLLLVLSSSSASTLPALFESGVDSGRVHRINLGPVSIRAATRALRPVLQGLDEDALRCRAARLVQQTEGLPAHLRAFMERPHSLTGSGRSPLPPSARESLLAGASGWRPELHAALSRLSMVYVGVDAALARAILGEDAPDLLSEALSAGVLSHAADEETVRLPGPDFTSSDLEQRLGFTSELLRTALAGSLTGPQRAALRARLADLLLPTHPGLSAYYAQRANLPELTERARAAYEAALQEGSPLRTAPRPAPSGRMRLVTEPPVTSAPRREVQTENGYRVATEAGQLEVIRLGRYGAPPLLRARLPAVREGAWRLVARVDVYRGGEELGPTRAPYPLALRVGDGERLVLRPDAPADYVEDGVRHRVLGGVPLGKWFELGGTGGRGDLEIAVRALDVAVTIGRLEWGGEEVPFQ